MATFHFDLVSPEKLLSLGILSPSQVDRICNDESKRRFLVEDFLPAQSLAIVGGESAIGKSPLLSQLALCVTAGLPFLGMPTERSRVLYFDLENSIFDCQTIRNSFIDALRS